MDDTGRLETAKTPTTPHDQGLGIVAGIDELAASFSVERPHLLGATDVMVLGTTVATNTMLEYTGSLTGLICTKGFRDMIELRRSFREDLFDLAYPPPVPICRRQRRLGVTERIDYAGRVVVPLDEEEVRAAARKLRDLGVASIAICFLFAHTNPEHEQRAAEIVAEEHPEAYVTLSSDVLPEIREFERVSTVLVNAYTTPPLRTYLRRLSDRLTKNGFDIERMLIMQSHGGVVTATQAAERGVSAVRSGPAGGVVAAAHIGRLCSIDDLIGIDMGGTSYDVSLIHGGVPQVRRDAWVSRYRVALPMLDIHAIGAGGGSIASLDEAGTLRVGPQSAGAVPGPACYGRGGDAPTVTDADIVLGLLDPESFLGGKLRLDPDLSRAAIEERVAGPLGWGVEDAAIAILRVVNNNMNNGVRYVSIARGHDPRGFALVAYGGAGAVHACMQAHDLHISRVLVPRDASVFCALGAVISDLRISLTHPYSARGGRLQVGALNEIWNGLRDRAAVTLSRAAQSLRGTRGYRFLDARYVGQAHEVTVPIDSANGSLDGDELSAAVERFHDLHEALYAFKNPEQEIEVLNLRYDLVGMRAKPETPPLAIEESVNPAAAYHTSRAVQFEVDGRFRPLDTPVFSGTRLQPGNVVTGPAVIQEAYTTLVVCPGQRARLNEHLVYVVDTGAAS